MPSVEDLLPIVDLSYCCLPGRPYTASPVSGRCVSSPATPSSLDHSLVSGIAWTALLRWFAQIISWIATLYAARLLAPGDYGLVSMAMLAIGLARMVEDFGLDAVLVQDRNIVGEARARLAGFLLAIALALCALYALAAPLIAGFFSEPHVTPIIMTLSLVFLADALQVVPRAQLQRELRFGRLAMATLVQVITTSVVLVVAARAGLGHWSLVVNTLAGALAATVLLIVWEPYTIAWPRDLGRLARPFLQGWRILASRIAWYGYTNVDQTLVGRVLGKDALGAYSFAVTFSNIAQQEVGAVVSRVVPGIFSEIQNNRAELRRYFLLLTEFLAVIIFPCTIGLALTADLVMPLLLGPQWSEVVTPLRLLCINAAFLASQTLLSHVLMWTGQFRANMWCTVVAGVMMPLVLWFAVDYGLPGIGWAWVIFMPIATIPTFVLAFRTLELTTMDWVDSIKPALVATLLMSAAVIGVRSVLPPTIPLVAQTALAIGVGAATYAVVVWFVFGARIKALLSIARSMRTR